ncbi:beta strand repeat-containing protein [Azospirillum canadense]|uniref:beta strand repeat-containing protein n=1 Tax=Azospirillum canadense TaxID=403962 RepID=UPI002226783A|nr:filamentous hemagglutinin N-terminal domain-containing protein [Azospirillum canadense]MCW2239659.1 filamentous hemagglutinin family protein [Azospirillum canadense]
MNLSGGRIEVGAGLGTQAGGNLFHSFETFNVNRGQTVTFTGPDSVRNVVGRVTGGSASTIDGTLRSTVGQADVYLINPAGVTFGPSAVVDVPASLHVGTAHEVRFADGARFSALDRSGSTFTTAPPEAFGFLDRPAGALRVDQSRLSVKPGHLLSLIGGDVEVRGGTAGRIEAPGGTVTVSSVTGAGRVRLADGATEAAKQGAVRLHDRARLDTSGVGGGSVRIRGGTLVVENSTVTTNNTGGRDATGGMDLEGRSLTIADSTLRSEATGSGTGAPIRLRAGSLSVRDGARVTSAARAQGGSGGIAITTGNLSIEGIGATFSTVIESVAQEGATGPAAPIAVSADRLSIGNGGAIVSRTTGAGNAADIAVSSGSVVMAGEVARGARSRIVSEGLPMASGNTGSVTVAATGAMELSGTAQIGTRIEGSGNAGAVTVTAGSIGIVGAAGDVFTGIVSQAAETATGTGGPVTVGARSIALSGPYAEIGSDTLGSAHAGSVAVNADRLSITGVNGAFDGFTSVFVGIQANTHGSGNAGTVRVSTTGELVISHSGEIASNTFSVGNAGDVTVRAGSLLVTEGEGSDTRTGIGSTAEEHSGGRAGTVRVTTPGALTINPGGVITSDTFAKGDAGAVTVEAGSLSITGNNGADFTGISSDANRTSEGNAGAVQVTTIGNLTISQGGVISSDTYAKGNAIGVTVQAGSLSITGNDGESFTGIGSDANPRSEGNAGRVGIVVAGPLSISHDGEISSSTYAQGNAGDVTVWAGSLSIAGFEGNGTRSGIGSTAERFSGGHAGTVRVATPGALTITPGGIITSDTFAKGDAGGVMVQAGSLSITGNNGEDFTGITSRANEFSEGNAGTVAVTTVGDVAISQGGVISSSTFAKGDAGAVAVEAGSLSITGNNGDSLTGIASNAYRRSEGHAGTVQVTTAGPLAISQGGIISNDTYAKGNAGGVTVRAGALSIAGNDGESFTGIGSDANLLSGGNAGTVDLLVAGPLTISHDGEISSSTYAQGNAGDVTVWAGSLSIAGFEGNGTRSGIGSTAERFSGGHAGTVRVATPGALTITPGGIITSDTFAKGDAGGVTVQAGSLSITGNGGEDFTGITSSANRTSEGNAGTVRVTTAGPLAISRGGVVNSDTYAKGNAGNVVVQAGSLLIDGANAPALTGIASNANTGSRGNAGTVTVATAGTLALVDAGEISSNTFAHGNAGAVSVHAGSLLIDGVDGPPRFTGIGSSAEAGSNGNGGTVDVTADGPLALTHGGQIRSLTFEQGNAGAVTVRAGELQIDRDGAQTLTGVLSSAQPDSTGDGGSISINAESVLLRRDGLISAESAGSGLGGPITLTVTDTLSLDQAAIQTQTMTSNGGDIAIGVGRLLDMRNSAVTTSVAGGTGSGGNIVIDPPFAVLQNSRIQANAQKGSGGNITVRADQLLTTPDTLIEASSAESVSGTISTPAPDNTIASSLVKLPESFLNTRDLLRDSCAGRGGRASSSLIVGNGGGLPLDPAGPLPSPYGGFRNGELGVPHRATGSTSELPLRFHVAGTSGCG